MEITTDRPAAAGGGKLIFGIDIGESGTARRVPARAARRGSRCLGPIEECPSHTHRYQHEQSPNDAVHGGDHRHGSNCSRTTREAGSLPHVGRKASDGRNATDERAFDPPTQARRESAAVAALNREGALRWEAVGMTALSDGTVAVVLKSTKED